MHARAAAYLSALFLVVAVAAAAFAARAANPFKAEGGVAPVLDVNQAASAEDGGIRISVNRAAFSGSATFVEVAAAATTPEFEGATRVTALGNAFSPSSLILAPDSRGLSIPVGSTSVARLAPVAIGTRPELAFTRVEVALADGTWKSVAGNWKLPLDTPPDLAERLRVEHLGGAATTSNGVSLAAEGATRSSTETLVTVNVTPGSQVRQLGEPSMLIDGELVRGGLVAEQEGGALLSYSFPPTRFGSDITVSFGPFVREGDPSQGKILVDVGAILTRQQARGEDQETLPAAPGDTLLAEGALTGIRSIVFTQRWGSNLRPAPAPSLLLVLDGALAGPPLTITATGPNGKQYPAEVGGIGYSKDAAGTISSPRTEIVLQYSSMNDLRGVFTIEWAGREEAMIRGAWRLELSPAK